MDEAVFGSGVGNECASHRRMNACWGGSLVEWIQSGEIISAPRNHWWIDARCFCTSITSPVQHPQRTERFPLQIEQTRQSRSISRRSARFRLEQRLASPSPPLNSSSNSCKASPHPSCPSRITVPYRTLSVRATRLSVRSGRFVLATDSLRWLLSRRQRTFPCNRLDRL